MYNDSFLIVISADFALLKTFEFLSMFHEILLKVHTLFYRSFSSKYTFFTFYLGISIKYLAIIICLNFASRV